jgi:hypothetical protein
MLVLDSSESNSDGTFTLSQPISGYYELVHQYIEYHEPNAVDYTCNEIDHKTATGLTITCTLDDQVTLSNTTIATNLNDSLDTDATVTTSGSNGISIQNTSGEVLTLDFPNSSGKILFKNSHEALNIPVGETQILELEDRSVVKHYTLDIEEANGYFISSGKGAQLFVLSSYEDIIAGQRTFIPQETSTLTFKFREYSALVDYQWSDIPRFHLLLKKV